MPLLELTDVTKTFRVRRDNPVRAVGGVTIGLEAGETLGLIGESGSGKSTLARLALRLTNPDSGHVRFRGEDLGTLDAVELRRRRASMSIVFQEPYDALNPRRTVQATVAEPLLIHDTSMTRRQRVREVCRVLEAVGLGSEYLERYPHEMSGGQQQRVGIARAIVTNPALVVLDEPTSSLDLSTRAQILALLGDLQRQLGLAYLLISHDMTAIANLADRVAVLYLGRVVEEGPCTEVIHDPRHPYTRALIGSILRIGAPPSDASRFTLRGELAAATSEAMTGCPLVGRCPLAERACSAGPVPLESFAPGRSAACVQVHAPDAQPHRDHARRDHTAT